MTQDEQPGAELPQEPLEVDRRLTIGVSAYGNSIASRHCLQAILQSLRGDFELLLVDDCSPDSGKTLSLFMKAKALHPNTKVFSFRQNREYSGSLNAILSHAEGDRVVFVSNDIITTPSYFGMLLEAERSHGAGIYRGSSNFVDNGLASHNIPAGQEISSNKDVAQASARLAHQYAADTTLDTYLTGDAFLVSRPVIQKIGTIDPIFFGYFADHDFGLRAQIAGFQLRFVPGAWAYHHQGTNFSYLPEAQRREKLTRRWSRVHENWARFKMKYHLPVALPYTNINDIPWQALAKASFSPALHYCPPVHSFDDLKGASTASMQQPGPMPPHQ